MATILEIEYCLPVIHASPHPLVSITFNFSDHLAGEGNGNPLQDSCLENSMGYNHGVTMSQTRLRDFTFTFNCQARHFQTPL